ncbi:Golgi resident protein [Schistosoma japonicum]|uniref:Golgi resident protein n=1 Tax=Schistosoma japonicum TaxID=6182 RepID=C1L3U5_SCHJA|nr:Golgi resident protein GCP60 [Schistosoma japonicum]TNN12056.1 Golgi resident protein [Schistosoma japonicum]CAX69373.1 Golgi resident protein GCP60 (Acyl-CoA-binding domain-containing protein 3) [Schistosoma japonicum]
MYTPSRDCFESIAIVEFQSKYKLDLDEIFDLAQTFFNEKAEKAFHLSFDDRIHLSALICVKKFGKYEQTKAPVPGLLDIIGQTRNARWETLSDMKPKEVQVEFINRICHLCPLFISYLEAYSRSKGNITDHSSKEVNVCNSNEPAVAISNGNQSCFIFQNEAQIREALNSQTESQFQSYASLHHPTDAAKRAELIAKLQDRHFHEYMTYIQRQYRFVQQPKLEPSSQITNISTKNDSVTDNAVTGVKSINGVNVNHITDCVKTALKEHNMNNINCTAQSESSVHSSEAQTENLLSSDVTVSSVSCTNTSDHDKLGFNNDPCPNASLVVHAPTLWTRGEVKEFKLCLAEDEESVIRINSGEVYSVRVQTHPSGTSIVWEFATDDYDIGFGLFFEWTEAISDPEVKHNNHVLPINKGDAPSEVINAGNSEQSSILVDEIIPISRQNSQSEVCCGSHLYPGPGTYVFKFDNSFSLWRSKTLYYRVCYTY